LTTASVTRLSYKIVQNNLGASGVAGTVRIERYEAKRAVIIGGTSGMGSRRRRCSSMGARVLVTGRSQAGLESAQQELGKDALVVSSDERSLMDIDALASRVKTGFDTIDLLFVNAGFSIRAPLGV
jgi:NADP-dependent 3-hydroxy acid dehydrogenase YdfG